MKVTKEELSNIIKEEVDKALKLAEFAKLKQVLALYHAQVRDNLDTWMPPVENMQKDSDGRLYWFDRYAAMGGRYGHSSYKEKQYLDKYLYDQARSYVRKVSNAFDLAREQGGLDNEHKEIRPWLQENPKHASVFYKKLNQFKGIPLSVNGMAMLRHKAMKQVQDIRAKHKEIKEWRS